MQSGPHTKLGPGGAPVHPLASQIGKHVAGSQVCPGGNGWPVPVLQSTGHVHAHEVERAVHAPRNLGSVRDRAVREFRAIEGNEHFG